MSIFDTFKALDIDEMSQVLFAFAVKLLCGATGESEAYVISKYSNNLKEIRKWLESGVLDD